MATCHTFCPLLSPEVCSLVYIELVMLSNHIISCCPLLLLPSVFPIIRDFSNELAPFIRWPEYWSFSFSVSPSNELYSGLISFRMDWLDLLAVQGTLKSLLQHHSSKAPQFINASEAINSSSGDHTSNSYVVPWECLYCLDTTQCTRRPHRSLPLRYLAPCNLEGRWQPL